LQLSIDRDQLDVVRQQVGAGMNDSVERLAVKTI
jgi:hypothetical protein